MTRYEHYRAAERFAKLATDEMGKVKDVPESPDEANAFLILYGLSRSDVQLWLMLAQVHATLANTEEISRL